MFTVYDCTELTKLELINDPAEPTPSTAINQGFIKLSGRQCFSSTEHRLFKHTRGKHVHSTLLPI